MTQLRIWDFGAPRKSEYLNDHFVGVVPTKRVYRGYNVVETSPPSLNLNINVSFDSSVLVTDQGVRVEETANILNAVTIAPDPVLDRIDWVLASHEYTNSNNQQTYEVLEGTAGAPPIPPSSVPAHKVLLATVYVPAGATVITNDLINISEHVSLGTAIDRGGFLELRPDPQQSLNDTVFINAGTYVKSDGTDVVTVPDDVGSGVAFAAVTSPGRERYDLLGLDDTGSAVIVQGVEAAAGFGDAPAYPTDLQIIAEVFINESSSVSISQQDIRDVRFFFNLGGGAGGGGDCCSGIVNYEIYVATPQQNTFDLGFTYSVGSDRLHVLLNGVKQILGVNYVETDDDTITFLFNLNSGENVEFIYYGAAGCPTVRCPAPTVYERHVSAANQTVFNLATGYQVGTNSLWVLVNGVRQTVGTDFTETNATTVTFSSPLVAGIEVVFIQMGEGGGNVVTSRQEFSSTTGQTLFDLTFSYVGGQNELFVWAAGSLMQEGIDYTETSPTSITFNVGRPNGQQVVVARIGTSNAGALRLWEKQTAVAGQSVFNLLGSYTPAGHGLQVFKEGSMLTVIDDYTETSINSVSLVAPAVGGETFIFMVSGGDVIACTPGTDLGVKDEGVVQGLATTMDFVGSGVTAQVLSGAATVTIPGAPPPPVPLMSGFYRGLSIETVSVTQLVIFQGAQIGMDDGSEIVTVGSNITIDINNPVGNINALDAGSEAANTWYYIYLITDGVTPAGLLSASSAAPTLPVGYTKKRLVGAVRNDGSSDFRSFIQNGVYVESNTNILSAFGGNGTQVSVDISGAVPIGFTQKATYNILNTGDIGLQGEYNVSVRGSSTASSYEHWITIIAQSANSGGYAVQGDISLVVKGTTAFFRASTQAGTVGLHSTVASYVLSI